MQELKVVYTDIWRDGLMSPKTYTISRMADLSDLTKLEHDIDRGVIDRVLLVGRFVCTGWRLVTDRPIVFEVAKGVDPESPEARQAKGRIRCSGAL